MPKPTPSDIRPLPKALLHDHLDGGLRVGTVLELADDAGYSDLPTTDPDDLAAWFHQADSRSLGKYLQAFRHTVGVMQTQDALERVAYEAVIDLHADGVVYAELRFGPALHVGPRMRYEDVFEAVISGVARGHSETGVEVVLIASAIRNAGNSEEVARGAIPFLDSGVAGFDLAGPEAGQPARTHVAACRMARENGMSLTIHAGEGDGPHSVWQAVALCGASRIGHGVRIIESMTVENASITRMPSLARRIRDERIALEMALTSNLHTGLYPTPESHPFGVLHRAGFNVTLNTDNRLMSGVTLTDEYALAARSFDLSPADLGRITENALLAGFGDWPTRRRLIEEVVRPAYALESRAVSH